MAQELLLPGSRKISQPGEVIGNFIKGYLDTSLRQISLRGCPEPPERGSAFRPYSGHRPVY